MNPPKPTLRSQFDSPISDLLCFSHLRWNFVLQRPQHLLGRMAQKRRVFFFEEPIFNAKSSRAYLKLERSHEGVYIATPVLPPDTEETIVLRQQTELLDQLISDWGIHHPTTWFYSPLALKFAAHVKSTLTIYDCMDELSMFRGASRELVPLERKLLKRANLVFTGGHSLFEAKRHLHPNIHPFPSSIDFEHFARARAGRADTVTEAKDQRKIPGPRIGFYGVIDERFDLKLMEGLAEKRPHWQFVIVGPIVKIDPKSVPQKPNIHYLGKRDYADLPSYLTGWDAAILPFARNDATRFISPTKTPEYLAAGRPVVSTSIRDVIRPYNELGLVEIADEPGDFAVAIEKAVRRAHTSADWLRGVDNFLSKSSWDQTLSRMNELEEETLSRLKTAQSQTSRILPPDASFATGFSHRYQEAASSGQSTH